MSVPYKLECEVEVCSDIEMIECGFRQEWVTANIDEDSVDVTSGAGCGSPWMTATIKIGDKTHNIRYNIKDLIKKLYDKAKEGEFDE